MKKQTNPTIHAHLMRGAFYLLLLLAVCAIPFALAQRNTAVQRRTKPAITPSINPVQMHSSVRARPNAPTAPNPGIPFASGRKGVSLIGVPAHPEAPQIVLYDQYDNAAIFGTLSATFSDFPDFNSDLADDFIVPAGETWSVESIDADGFYFPFQGPADSFNVFFYADNAGLPGTQVYSATNQPFSVVGSTFTVNLSSPAMLAAGTYWVEIQANMTFVPNGAWLWTDRTVQSNNGAAWQNPGGGFGFCQTWTLKTTCIPFAAGPDQVFRLNGTITGVTPTPTATPTASATATATAAASATPTATPTCSPEGGLLVGDGLTIGYPPNNFTTLASNIVNYTFANSHAAANDYAIFQTHNPWGATVVEDAITAAGHTFSVFTPAQLAGFNFSDYRVIVLNWDDHFLIEFLPDYAPAIPALEAYISGGGVVWVQGAIQGQPSESYPLPFGGQADYNLSPSDWIVDPASPMVAGVPNPIVGNFASHVSDSGLPADAHVVVTVNDPTGPPVLYDLRRGTSCGGTPTPTPTPTATATATATPTATPTPTGTPVGCVFGQGYWKNHPEAWPVTELQLGNVTYTQEELLSILHQPVRGNGLVSLAHHLIAAKLNIANGADPSCIQQTIADADALIGDLVVPPVGDGYLAPRDVEALKDMLEDYNEGRLCAPSCDQSPPPTATPMARRARPTPAPRPR